MQHLKTRLAAAVGMLAITATSNAAQFGAGIKTPGYEDVVVLDMSTLAIAVGGDDGIAAGPIANAYINAQRVAPNKAPTSLTERVFAAYLPKPNNNTQTPSGAAIQNLVLKRKQDVIGATRYLLSVQMEPYFDMQNGNNNRERLVVRDNLGRYAVRLRTNPGLGSFYVKNSDTKQISFQMCYRTDSGEFYSYQSNHGRNDHCIGIPNFTGLNVPAGFFVSDISKFGDLGYSSMLGGQQGTSTLRAGFIVTPSGHSGTAGVSTQGRNFASTELVVWDVATFEIIAGPFQLKTKNPDVIYATNNCKKTASGLSLVIDPAGNCGQQPLNPSLPVGTMVEVQE